MGSMHDVLNAFRSPKALVGIPEKWSGVLRASPKALCWYPAHISSQVRSACMQWFFLLGLRVTIPWKASALVQPAARCTTLTRHHVACE